MTPSAASATWVAASVAARVARVARPLRRRLTHPLAPVFALAAAALPARGAEPLTWAVLGGLAGYALSGSV